MDLKAKLKQIKEREESNKVDWNARKNLWIKQVSDLYEDICGRWLSEYLDEGYIKMSFRKVTASEERLGQYDLNALELKIGEKTVVLEPVGTLIIGAYGRIDMYLSGYKSEKYMLLLSKNDDGSYTWLLSDQKIRRAFKVFSKDILEKIIDEWVS